MAGGKRHGAWMASASPAPPSPDVLGFGLDRPAAGETGDGWSIIVAGWVVGRSSPVAEVHILQDGELVRRAPVVFERPGVAKLLALNSQQAAHPGFWVHVGLLGLPTTAKLEVCAMLTDATPVHLGTIVVSHQPMATGYSPRLAPIIVTSLGRMGTTWLMRLLAAHPQVVVHGTYPYELGIAKYWTHLLRVAAGPADHLDSSHPETFTADLGQVGHNPYFGDFLAESPELNRWLAREQPGLLGAAIQRSIDGFYQQVAKHGGVSDARYFAEKGLPDHVPDLLRDLYPHARELILVRDIRDVICSVLAFDEKRQTRSFGREWLADDLGFVHQLHMDLERLVRGWRRRRDSARLVRYEAMVAAPVETVCGILEYLDLPATPAMVDSMLRQAAAPTPELDDHRTSASAEDSVGRWRRELADQHPELLKHCQEFVPLLAELGYPTSEPGHRAPELSRVLLDVLERLDTPSGG